MTFQEVRGYWEAGEAGQGKAEKKGGEERRKKGRGNEQGEGEGAGRGRGRGREKKTKPGIRPG